jgi:hypothetical protein
MTKRDIHKKAMLEALEASLGVVSTACKEVGISRETHYRWTREDEEYRRSVEELEGVALDTAESKLHEAIQGGNIVAIIFYLKTKGKVRGYVERSEVSVSKGKPDLSGLSDKEIMDMARDLFDEDKYIQ